MSEPDLVHIIAMKIQEVTTRHIGDGRTLVILVEVLAANRQQDLSAGQGKESSSRTAVSTFSMWGI